MDYTTQVARARTGYNMVRQQLRGVEGVRYRSMRVASGSSKTTRSGFSPHQKKHRLTFHGMFPHKGLLAVSDSRDQEDTVKLRLLRNIYWRVTGIIFSQLIS